MSTGKQLRDDGIERVLTPEQDWLERYCAILLDWFDGRPDGFRFTGEILRITAKDKGIDEPHVHNVWAAAASRVLGQWRREGKICDTGRLVSAKSPKTRAHAMRQYEKIVSRRYRVAEPENQMELLT